VFVRERVVAPRAPILDRNGFALVDNRDMLEVGVVPRQAGEIEPLSVALGEILGEDPGRIQSLIAPSPSDATVVVATRRADALASVEARLRAIPGVVLQPVPWPLTPDERFGRALFGRSGEVTAEILEEHPEIFQPGDIVGRSGLQRTYNARLAGLPGSQIRIDRRFATAGADTPSNATADQDTTETETGAAPDAESEAAADVDGGSPASPTAIATNTVDPTAEVDPDVVYLEPPVAGEPLQLTIDARVQRAAEEALATTALTSSLVVVQPSTGHILAVANGPGAAFENFALTGRYPPGSIFKIVTAYAAMAGGVAASDQVDCPPTLEVNGRVFRNSEGQGLGSIPLRRAFVVSCNTAFVNLGATLDPSAYPATAARFGIGVGYDLGTLADSGSIPTPDGSVDRAATSFGQGRTLMSPLSGAVMAATVAAGTYRSPRLVVEPAEIDGLGGAALPIDGQPLESGPAGQLQQFMRAVVTNGTGRAAAGAAGGPVSGKTGTAEFGTAVPPQAHAWFVGYQGDLAFAVFVEAGEFGGSTAAPIATNFLNRVASGG
jgi:cell division protein FtsI/penicillin-binding protein 2